MGTLPAGIYLQTDPETDHALLDNVRDGYVIVPYTNGGSYLNIINAKYEAKVAQPEDPVKPGYDFAGWYKR